MPESEWPVGMVEAFQAMATLALGDASGARDQARRVLDAGARNYSEEPAIELLVMADALIALGDWDGLATFLPELRARQRLVALGGPTADRAEGLLLANAGSTTAAIELLERAIVGFLTHCPSSRRPARASTWPGSIPPDGMSSSTRPWRRTWPWGAPARISVRSPRGLIPDSDPQDACGNVFQHQRRDSQAWTRTMVGRRPPPFRPRTQPRLPGRTAWRRPSSSSTSPRSTAGRQQGAPGAVNDLSLWCRPARSACSSGRRAAARRRRSRWSTG